jgi:coenzyme PQQ synthesis protein D (PqqD)
MDHRQRLRDLAINDRGFAFDPYSGLSFSINGTGRYILEKLKEGAEPNVIPELLAAAFEVAPGEDLARDVREFLRLLGEHGLFAASAPT